MTAKLTQVWESQTTNTEASAPDFSLSDKPKEKEKGEEVLLKLILVKLTQKSSMEVVSHTFTNIENSLLYQGQHDYIMNQQ